MASLHLEPASRLSQVVRFNNSYAIQHFCGERALNSLHFLEGASARFLRTPLLRRQDRQDAPPIPAGSSSPTGSFRRPRQVFIDQLDEHLASLLSLFRAPYRIELDRVAYQGIANPRATIAISGVELVNELTHKLVGGLLGTHLVEPQRPCSLAVHGRCPDWAAGSCPIPGAAFVGYQECLDFIFWQVVGNVGAAVSDVTDLVDGHCVPLLAGDRGDFDRPLIVAGCEAPLVLPYDSVLAPPTIR